MDKHQRQTSRKRGFKWILSERPWAGCSEPQRPGFSNLEVGQRGWALQPLLAARLWTEARGPGAVRLARTARRQSVTLDLHSPMVIWSCDDHQSEIPLVRWVCSGFEVKPVCLWACVCAGGGEVLLSAHSAWLSLSVTTITIGAFLTQSYFLSWCRLCLVCITC